MVGGPLFFGIKKQKRRPVANRLSDLNCLLIRSYKSAGDTENYRNEHKMLETTDIFFVISFRVTNLVTFLKTFPNSDRFYRLVLSGGVSIEFCIISITSRYLDYVIENRFVKIKSRARKKLPAAAFYFLLFSDDADDFRRRAFRSF
jgi:hypothetical protein